MSIRLFAAAALAAAAIAWPARAHEGHDHGAAPPPVSTSIAPRGEAASDLFELVAVADGDRLVLHLDRFGTNEPVPGATLTVETPDGPAVAESTGLGGYTLAAPWLVGGGHHDLIVTVADGASVDVLTLDLDTPAPALPPLAVPNPAARIQALAADLGLRLARMDPILVAASAGSFLLGLLAMRLARSRRGSAAVAVLALAIVVLTGSSAIAHGDDGAKPVQGAALVAPPRGAGGDLAQRLSDGAVFVPKPTQRLLVLRTETTHQATYRRTLELPGRIIPDPNASGIVQSSVGGRLGPPASGLFPRLGTPVRKGDVLATVTPPIQAVDVSDMRQTQGEIDQQLAIVARRVERFTRLATSGAVAQTQLDDALAELRGLKERRASLDLIRREPETLVAPVDGVVAQAAAVSGQLASPGTVLFQIVDPRRLWVEALSFDTLAAAQDASARLADGRSLALGYQGSGLVDRNQAVPVQFAVTGDTAGVRIGQFVTVLAATDTAREGLALPRSAVVRTANGQDVVYEHVSAERFVARPVRVEPLDGARILVAEGVGPGRRVVTQGAELLDQVR
ncbi:efflux RND transporter periplasmic adaptor subunit [uncultured Methylobacterium sp.]|uniref:efflux RND transporter periplasmic adaptor subunit n=1 Tax=uncultured Methylobacterium sp. TaxID=157278 RepID=UPI0035CB1BDB